MGNFKKSDIENKYMSRESGVVLPLLALLIVAIVAVVGMLIDSSRQNLTTTTLQDVADSAAKGAVRQFNGTLEGWEDARKAAIVALSSNSVAGADADALQGIEFNLDGPYGLNTVGKKDGLTVSVARGVLWQDPEGEGDSQAKRFVSLEDFGDEDDPEVGSPEVSGPWKFSDFDTHILGNAVKVTVTLDELAVSSFGQRFIGKSIDDLSRTSLAISDSLVDVPVAPFAIPYCQLKLDTDPNVQSNHEMDVFNHQTQLGRELFFTELQGFNTGGDSIYSAGRRRREGIQRYLSHIYHPVANFTGSTRKLCRNTNQSGPDVNCKTTPIQGVLGAPADRPGYLSNGREFAEILTNAGGGELLAGVGSYFKPLERWGNRNQADEATEAMRTFIRNSAERFTIRDLYMYQADNGSWYAKLNFPAVKYPQTPTTFGDDDFLRRPNPSDYIGQSPGSPSNRTNTIVMPFDTGLGIVNIGFVMGAGRAGELADGGRSALPAIPARTAGFQPFSGNVPFINPLCNDAVGGFGDGSENLDSPDYKVTRVNVMVIAPSTTSDSSDTTYCDFEAMFEARNQDVAPPDETTRPRVVGIIPIELVGFNFRRLDDSTLFPDFTETGWGGQPTPRYSDGITTITDTNSAFVDLGFRQLDSARNFQTEYNDCIDEESVLGGDGNACDNSPQEYRAVEFPEEYRQCFNIEGYEGEVNGLMADANATESEDELKGGCKRRRCTSRGPFGGCLNEEKFYDDDCVNDKKNSMAERLTNLDLATIPSNPFQHCLPLPNVDATDFNNPDHYSDMGPRSPGRGCGGVRAKVTDTGSESVMLHSGKRWSEMRPVTVEESQL